MSKEETKWQIITISNFYRFPVNQACLQYSEYQILLFGGFYNEEHPKERVAGAETIKLLDLRTNRIEFIEDHEAK